MNSISSGLTAMRRSPYQTLVAVIMVTLTCFVAYSFSLLVLGAQRVLTYFEAQPQIIAFFDVSASDDNVTSLQHSMESKPYVASVKVVTKQQALDFYRQDKKDNPLLLDLVTADILPASVEVSGKTVDDLDQISQDLKTAPGVKDVSYQRSIIQTLSTWTHSLRLIGIGVSVILALTSFLIIMVVIGIKITAKRQAIYIMRMIGATRWYIKKPFMFEGMIYGLVGSILGWLLMYGGLLYLTPWLMAFVNPVPLLPVPYEILGIQLAIGTFIAMMIGGFASLTASQRIIRR